MIFTGAPQVAAFSQAHRANASVSGTVITHSTQGMSGSFDCADS
jgi:hypothetical protein